MEMRIFNEVVFFEKPTVESVIAKINEVLDKDHFLSHFIVDGIEVYREPEEYLNLNLHGIEKLEVFVKTIDEFIYELLLSSKDYIKRAKPELMRLESDFYKSPTADSWENFLNLLDGIQWLNTMINTIDQSRTQPDNWAKYLGINQELQVELKNLQEAMENKDNVLIADIIQYEIYRLLESLESEIEVTMEKEGSRNDIN